MSEHAKSYEMNGYGAWNKEEVADFRFVLRDRIYAEILDNSDGSHCSELKTKQLLKLEIDDYRPRPDDRWDPDEWEERRGYILAPAKREFWKVAYRIARVLIQGKTFSYVNKEGMKTFGLPVAVTLS